MAKKQKRSRKIALLPMLAIGIGVYLLMRPKKVVVVKTDPPTRTPPLQTGDIPVIQRLRPRRYMPHYI